MPHARLADSSFWFLLYRPLFLTQPAGGGSSLAGAGVLGIGADVLYDVLLPALNSRPFASNGAVQGARLRWQPPPIGGDISCGWCVPRHISGRARGGYAREGFRPASLCVAHPLLGGPTRGGSGGGGGSGACRALLRRTRYRGLSKPTSSLLTPQVPRRCALEALAAALQASGLSGAQLGYVRVLWRWTVLQWALAVRPAAARSAGGGDGARAAAAVLSKARLGLLHSHRHTMSHFIANFLRFLVHACESRMILDMYPSVLGYTLLYDRYECRSVGSCELSKAWLNPLHSLRHATS